METASSEKGSEQTGAPGRRSGRGSLIDPRALMRIKSMELRAKVVVEGFLHGIHRSPYHGFSVEFTEYRDYTPGDDTRYLDWKLLARSDRHYIKKFEDETNLRCHLLVDHSRSMAFDAVGYSKAEYAGTMAATLARFLFDQGDAVGLMTFDQGIDAYLPARNRPGHLRRIMLALEQAPEGTATDVGNALQRAAEMLNKRGLLILFSDLLSPLEALAEQLGFLRAFGHEVVVFNLLDPAEREFRFDAPARFRDLESGRDLFVNPAAARATYRLKLEDHLAAVRSTCEKLGIDHHHVPTDRPLELTLQDFLGGRLRRDRGRRRHRGR